MIIKNPYQLTKLQVWQPRYKDGVALLSVGKVNRATPVILIEFTKAKHLAGQRFCIERKKAMNCPIGTNGTIECYAVPMKLLEGWETYNEINAKIKAFGW